MSKVIGKLDLSAKIFLSAIGLVFSLGQIIICVHDGAVMWGVSKELNWDELSDWTDCPPQGCPKFIPDAGLKKSAYDEARDRTWGDPDFGRRPFVWSLVGLLWLLPALFYFALSAWVRWLIK